MKDNLISVLSQQSYVATTTDGWTSYGRAYIGVTVHWIDSTTLQRKSAHMALRRVKCRHTYDAIAFASILDDIHAEYRIRKTIVRTTTDNGANFVKVFAVYARKPVDNADDDAADDVKRCR